MFSGPSRYFLWWSCILGNLATHSYLNGFFPGTPCVLAHCRRSTPISLVVEWVHSNRDIRQLSERPAVCDFSIFCPCSTWCDYAHMKLQAGATGHMNTKSVTHTHNEYTTNTHIHTKTQGERQYESGSRSGCALTPDEHGLESCFLKSHASRNLNVKCFLKSHASNIV